MRHLDHRVTAKKERIMAFREVFFEDSLEQIKLISPFRYFQCCC